MAGNNNSVLLLHFDEDVTVAVANDANGGVAKTIAWVGGDPAFVPPVVKVSRIFSDHSKYRNFFIDDPVAKIYFECVMKQTTGKTRARLFDITAGARVADSDVETTSSSFVRVRSAPIVIVKDHEYQRRMGTNPTDAGEVLGSQILGV